MWHNRPAKLSNSVKKTQDKGYHAVQSHSRSSRSVPIESPCAIFYQWLRVTDVLPRTVLELTRLIVQILDTLRFWAPFGGLGTTYDVHLGLIWKRVVDFLLVLITFSARCYGWGATSEYRFKIGDFAQTGAGWPRLNDLSYGIKIWTDLYSVLLQCTRLTDKRTDRQNSHRQTASAFHAAQ